MKIIQVEACPDHIYLLISIPPKYSVAQIMGYLKGKSRLMIFDRHANLKYKYYKSKNEYLKNKVDDLEKQLEEANGEEEKQVEKTKN